MKISNIFFDSFDSRTDLCDIGAKYGTDKSQFVSKCPYNQSDHFAHSYTPFYNTIFSPIRYREINFGEIGIYKNYSMKMWREYFPKANLYGWDCYPVQALEDRYKIFDAVQNAKQDNLNNTSYDYMNVREDNSIISAFKKNNIKYDVIIDDSDHEFWSQIRIIRNSYKFLKEGGFLIIEDVSLNEDEFLESISEYGHEKFYSHYMNIKTNHNDRSTRDCILLLIRNGVEQ